MAKPTTGSANKGTKLSGRKRDQALLNLDTNYMYSPTLRVRNRDKNPKPKSAGGGSIDNFADISNSPTNITFYDADLANETLELARGKKFFNNSKVSMDDLLGAFGVMNGSNVNLYFDDINKSYIIASIQSPYGTQTRVLKSNGIGKSPYIKNDYFAISEEFRGSGVGTKSLARQVEFASKLGVSHIDTYAYRSSIYNSDGTLNKEQSYNGYYTWPRLGYDANLSNNNRNILSNYYGKDVKTLRDLFDIPESSTRASGAAWWKQYGNSIDVKFDLSANSKSRKVLTEYTKKYFSNPEKNKKLL